ncbi:MAG: multidrug transporter AcrB [Candidatus Pelagibacter sp.]|nr:multidrug transporter AcrB [Candidatus Pelagibacter sp.]
MFLTELSIKRPVIATVMSLVLVLFGVFTFNKIPLRELPDIDTAKINIRTDYDGASAKIIDKQITQKIEERIGGTPGVISIDSISEDGRSSITLEFDLGIDLDVAANDVRDRVARISDELPDQAEPPQVYKSSANRRTTMWLAFQSSRMSDLELTDYADRYLKDQFANIPGVGLIRLGGERQLSLRLWLDPVAMAARNITTDELEDVLKTENVEFPAGKIESKDVDLVIKVQKAYKNLNDYNELVLKRAPDGSIIKLKDIARVEFGALTTNTLFKGNGNQTVGIGIYQQSTANTIEVAQSIKKKVEKIRPTLPPGSDLAISFDRSEYIQSAIFEVYKTILISIVLVIIIIYLFLGNLTGVIIPAVTIPVGLISTFLAIYLAGFSLNLFTLMALVLAIGIVVDDAIVMGENISRRMEKGENRLVAAYKGSKQVAFPIIATTVVLVSVFLPLVFIKGLIGKLFLEMAVTLSFAVCISSFVALSLSPMIGSKYLKVKKSKSNIVIKFNNFFKNLEKLYFDSLKYVISKSKSIITFLVLILIITSSLFFITKKELLPKEDRGVFFIIVKAPEGSGFNYTASKAEEIEKMFLPEVGKGEIRRLLLRVPGFGRSSKQVNSSFILVLLENWSDRKRDGKVILRNSFQKISKVSGVIAFPVMPQAIRAGGVEKPIQFVILGNTYEELENWKNTIKTESLKNPNLLSVEDDYNLNKPELNIEINNEKAADLGVSIQSIGRSIETMFGSRKVTKFTKQGKEYSIVLQSDIKNRQEPSNLNKIYVRSNTTGKLIPISNIVSISEKATAPLLSRYDRQRAVTISARISENYSIDEALKFLNKIVRDKLPEDARVSYKGASEEYKKTNFDLYIIFVLALITAYLALAAQFESWRHPLTIMLSVPFAIFGGLIGLLVAGSSLNIYSQIGLIILIGLSAKNGILIVEFANQLRVSGKKIQEAVLEASKIRFRPILMTSLSTIVGVLPLILGSGPGEASRLTIGVVIFMGMIFTTFFTLYIIPSMYLVIGKNTDRIDAVEVELKKQIKI